MQRALLFAILVTSVLFAGTLQAQRGGGGARGGGVQGGGARAGTGATLGGHPGSRNGFPGYSRWFNRNNGSLYPFWDGGYGWYDDSDAQFDEEQPYPEVMRVLPDRARSVTLEIPPANPKVIDVPGTSELASKPLPSVMFILTNGERLETQRYLLTHDNLYVTIDRQQRTIPLAMLDLKATVAANRERGIDLRVPADRNEISLSF